ncbi:LacI family DNA-binding transcriptional regulator [Pseudopedobacter beijingensis]|uniref:LacI family DNA-binding transcriptional regulator n=1 Tax=Pseudopedobacter beijingensis TaxID=1207056 RepID=A0ABW4IGQ4_9SPHI
MKRRNITIKDLARILNISVSTVSRALRDTYDVNQETRQKVVNLANELNYKPNFNATGLAKGSTHNLGIVLPFITNYYFSTVITGIQEVAYNSGYNITLYVTNDSHQRELQILEDLTISNLDGLLICASSDSNSSEYFENIISDGVPIVFFDRVIDTIDTSKVMQDDYNGAFEAVEHLIERGYTKIAHIAGPKGLTFTEKRLNGYKEALIKNNLPITEEWIIHSEFSQESGEKDMDWLLQQNNMPDAIFAVNDRKAIGAMQSLKKHKIIIGKDIGIIGFTNDPMSSIITPGLTTIAEPAYEIGKLSCELLIKHITKTYFHAEEKILPGKLIIRESTIRS